VFANPLVFNANVIRNVYMKKDIGEDLPSDAKFLALLHHLSVNYWSLHLEFVIPGGEYTRDYEPQNLLGDALELEDEDFSTGTWNGKLRRVNVTVPTEAESRDKDTASVAEFCWAEALGRQLVGRGGVVGWKEGLYFDLDQGTKGSFKRGVVVERKIGKEKF
jgi:hypothetical protein